MARPFWQKLFGANGPTTIQELRDAILTAPIGQGGGRFFGRLFDTGHDALDLAAPGGDTSLAGLSPREQASIALATLAGHDPATAPAGDDAGRNASLYLNGIAQDAHAAGISPFAHLDTAMPYMLVGDFQTGLLIDTATRTILPGGPGDYPELGHGSNDTMVLDGDYSAGFVVTTPLYVDQLFLRDGHDYNLIADDANVGPSALLTVNASALGDGNHIIFDGSAESDGRFLFLGSGAGDVFLGGAGDDRLYGGGGADILSGGGGHDLFGYTDAAQSTGSGYDLLADFNPIEDKIDLNVTVTGFDGAVRNGGLSSATFGADLNTALAGLGAGHAAYFAPTTGDLAGNIFLVVDANGIAGYQEGEDYVFAISGGAPLADLTAHTNIFV